MKITHFGANLKVDHLCSNHQANRGDILPICLSPCVAQLWSFIKYIWYKKEWFTLFHSHFLLHLNLTDSNPARCGAASIYHTTCAHVGYYVFLRRRSHCTSKKIPVQREFWDAKFTQNNVFCFIRIRIVDLKVYLIAVWQVNNNFTGNIIKG